MSRAPQTAGTLLAELAAMLTVDVKDDSYHAVLKVSPSLSVLKDHFAHQPILPGVCMVQAALLAAAQTLGRDELRLISVKNAKMTYPISPGDEVELQGSIVALDSNSWQIKTRLTMGDRRVAELSLLAR